VLSSEVCQLLVYWRSLGGGKKVPERCALNLRHLTAILPWMFILEMASDGSLRYRLAGSALEEAIGRGMAGETFGHIFSDTRQAALMEELYAVALVQSCGILGTGSFKLKSDNTFDMEVITLPFLDPRAMGSTILLGVFRPFQAQNRNFVDKWGEFDQKLEKLLTIPSPRSVTASLLSLRVHSLLEELEIELRAMDLEKVMKIEGRGLNDRYPDVPSLSLDSLETARSSTLN